MTHDDVWHVLPFFVNGTLRGQARADVEAHLAACADCRAELDAQSQVRDAILREDVRQESAQTSFDQLWERILEDEAVVEGRASNIAAVGAGTTVLRPPAGRTMKWLVAAVIVEGVGLATLGAMTWSNTQGLTAPAEYRTLSAPEPVIPGGQIRAVFSPDLKLSELQTLLATSKLSVVGGPTEAGVYTLALDDTSATVDAALARLRSDASVRFAEPIGKSRIVER